MSFHVQSIVYEMLSSAFALSNERSNADIRATNNKGDNRSQQIPSCTPSAVTFQVSKVLSSPKPSNIRIDESDLNRPSSPTQAIPSSLTQTASTIEHMVKTQRNIGRSSKRKDSVRNMTNSNLDEVKPVPSPSMKDMDSPPKNDAKQPCSRTANRKKAVTTGFSIR